MNIDDLFVQLVETLDREIEILDTIRYRLIVLGALAEADQGIMIPNAVKELESSYESLRLSELVRDSLTIPIADELTLDPVPKLSEIANRASGGWSEILLDRRKSIIEMVNQIHGHATAVTGAMGRRALLAEEALKHLRTDGGATYGQSGSSPRAGVLVEGAI